jgi:2'-5' RNA ligase
LMPDAVAANRIHAFAERTLGEKGLHPAARLHVTLALTEDFSMPQPALLSALRRAGESVMAPSFMLRLDRLAGGQNSVALRPARSLRALWTLQRQLVRAMAVEGVPLRSGVTFNPHLTLSYRGGSPDQRAIEDHGWPVEGFALIESLVGIGRYVQHGSWPLQGPAEDQLSLFPL